MDIENYTARQILEIKGSFLYFILVTTIGMVGIVFQILALVDPKNIVLTAIFVLSITSLSLIVYRRKKNKKSTGVHEWVIGFMTILMSIASRLNYARTMDWTYAAQNYQIAALAVSFLVIMQFFYNKKLLAAMTAVYFISWGVFLMLAHSNGVVFYPHSVIDGKVIHDGMQVHREIFFIIVMGIICFASYRNIPIMDDYDQKNVKQRMFIEKQSDAQKAMALEVRERMSGLFDRLETQTGIIGEFHERIQGQAASFEEIGATMEELLSSADRIAQISVEQLNAIGGMEKVINDFKNVKAESRKNLDMTFEDMSLVVSATSTGHEKIEAVTEAMNQMQSQGQRIGDTVTIITDIADKINLLSLNASIEAARAGDAGRGFAVVADEIGKLAILTADSIKEIKQVLTMSTKTTTEGVTVIQTAAVIIRDMIDVIGESADKIKLLQTGLGVEDSYIGSISGEMDRNIELARSIGNGTGEQKEAIKSTSRAIEDLNEMMGGMVRGIDELSELAKKIHADAQQLVEKSEEAVV